MKRNDVCPSCGMRLRREPPDVMSAAKWVCQRCKYKRYEGAETNPWKAFRRKKKREEKRTAGQD